MNAHTWLTEYEHRLSMLLSQVFIYVKAPIHINSHTKSQLGFSNFKFSTVRTVKRVELHHYAKLCRNRSNRSRDMAIFRFFKMATANILDFQNLKLLTFGTVKRVELCKHAKFC